MNRTPVLALALASALAVPSVAFTQSAETLYLRDNTPREVTVLQVSSDAVTIRYQGSEVVLPLKDLRPDSAYKLLRRRLSDPDAPGWLHLGEFCARSGLHREALEAYRRVIDLAPDQRLAIEAKMEEIRRAEGKETLDRARTLVREKKIEEALRAYSQLLEKHPTGPTAEAAKEELKRLAEEVQKQNEERQQRLAAAQHQIQTQRAKAEETVEAQRLARARNLHEEGRKLHIEGLDYEGRGTTGRARKAWEAAAAKIEDARVTLLDLQDKARTPDVQEAAKRELAAATRLLIAIYDSLGQMDAMDHSFRDAIRWFNKALALDPTDRVASDLKARIAAEHIVRPVRIGN
jgi:tetratricopeptide (TPR) repeat protein